MVRSSEDLTVGEVIEFIDMSNWFVHGLREFDVMKTAGHSNFETTRNFYLVIRDDLLDHARLVSEEGMKGISGTNLVQNIKKCLQHNSLT